MSQDNNVFKNQARRLQKHLAATFPGFTYSQSLEATAALHGAANWRTLIGQEANGAPSQMLNAENFRPHPDAFDELLDVPFSPAPQDDPNMDGVIQDWGMSKIDKFLQAEREYQYHVFHYFEHPDTGFSSAVRFVVDMCAYRVVAVQVEVAPEKWVNADAAAIAKFDATLKTRFIAVLKDYNFPGREEAFSPPEWATLVEEDSKSGESPRYLVSEGWGHIFGAGMPDSTVRFVFDMVENKIIFMDIMSWKGWVACGPDQMADVEDSLKTANEEVFTDPDDWGCTMEEELPEWARPGPVPSSPDSESEASPKGGRYIFGEWDHDYNGMGRPSRIRFVFDKKENRLCRLQDKVEGFWEESSSQMFSSVQNTFLGDEDFAIADPEGNDLVVSDELPPWAR